MAQDNIKLFSQFGIETRSQETILQEKEQARMAAALANTPQQGWYPGDLDLQRAGAGLGAALMNKLKKPELDPQQKLDLAARQYAKENIQTRLEEDEKFRKNVESNPQLASIETLRQMSKFYYDAGNVPLAAEVGMEAGRQLMEFRKQEREREKWQEERTDSQAKRQRDEEKHRRDIEDVTNVILPGAKGYSLEDLEGQVVTVRWDPEQESLVDTDGNKVDSFMSLEEAIDLRELALEEMGDAGVSGVAGLGWDTRVRLFNSALPASERTGLRMQLGAIETQAEIMNRTADMFEEFIAAGKDPAAFLDGAGRLTAFTTDIAKTIKTVGGTFFVPIAQGSMDELANGKGDVVAAKVGSEKFNTAYQEEINAIEIPAWITASDTTGDAAAEYQAAIIELAYAVARANEPGARQLSDTDFRNALNQLGAAAADPERLRRVIFQSLHRKNQQIKRAVTQVGEIAQTVGLPPEWGRDNVYGKTVRKEGLERFEETLGRYETLTEDLNAAETAHALDEAGVGRPEVQAEDEDPGDPSDPLNYFLAPE